MTSSAETHQLVLRDADIQQAVLRELSWNPRVVVTHIGVSVAEGIVTLTGWVDSYAERIAAEEAAHRVSSVLDVANDLHVKPPHSLTRPDAEIAQAVRHALQWDVRVPHERIQSTVADGWVTLRGTADRLQQREDAEHAVRYQAGVRGVTNAIAVTPPKTEADRLREEIVATLGWRTPVAAKRVGVTVFEDGTVILTGAVRSWWERETVVEAVRFTPGVQSVEDQLRIEPAT